MKNGKKKIKTSEIKELTKSAKLTWKISPGLMFIHTIRRNMRRAPLPKGVTIAEIATRFFIDLKYDAFKLKIIKNKCHNSAQDCMRTINKSSFDISFIVCR